MPEETIEPLFAEMKQNIDKQDGVPGGVIERIKAMLEYFKDTWMESTIWSIKEWCVSGIEIRTNNDVEGKISYGLQNNLP